MFLIFFLFAYSLYVSAANSDLIVADSDIPIIPLRQKNMRWSDYVSDLLNTSEMPSQLSQLATQSASCQNSAPSFHPVHFTTPFVSFNAPSTTPYVLEPIMSTGLNVSNLTKPLPALEEFSLSTTSQNSIQISKDIQPSDAPTPNTGSASPASEEEQYVTLEASVHNTSQTSLHLNQEIKWDTTLSTIFQQLLENLPTMWGSDRLENYVDKTMHILQSYLSVCYNHLYVVNDNPAVLPRIFTSPSCRDDEETWNLEASANEYTTPHLTQYVNAIQAQCFLSEFQLKISDVLAPLQALREKKTVISAHFTSDDFSSEMKATVNAHLTFLFDSPYIVAQTIKNLHADFLAQEDDSVTAEYALELLGDIMSCTDRSFTALQDEESLYTFADTLVQLTEFLPKLEANDPRVGTNIFASVPVGQTL